MPEQPLPPRVLNLFDTVCIVVGGIVGVGIFFTPASIVRDTGSAELAMTVWVIGGVIAMCGAFCFAELGARYHGNGAQYQVLRDAYGPLTAFLYVFCNATGIQAGVIAIIAVTCAQNLGIAVADGQPAGWPLVGVAAALIGALASANIIGVRWGSGIQNLTVVLKLLALAGIIVLAAVTSPASAPASPPPAPPAAGTFAALLTGLVAAFFSYGGWQHALWISGEVRNPRRNLPLAIILGVGLAIAVYLLANWAYLRLLGPGAMAASKALAADAVAAGAPNVGARVMAGAVALSAFGILNAQLLSGPRLVYGMAADGRFFAPFARLSPMGTPAAAVVLMAVLALVLLVAAGPKGVDILLNGVMTIDGLFLGMTGAAVIILRKRAPRDGSFRSPLFPLFPLIFVLGELGVVVGTFLNPVVRESAYIAAIWVAGAAVLYFARFRRAR